MVSLSCCLSTDLARDWCPFLYATDGAVVYGIGGSKAACLPEVARGVAAAAGQPFSRFLPQDASEMDDFVNEDGAHVMPVALSDFKTQFSIRKTGVKHAVVTEAAAFLQGVRSIVKNKRWHSKRVTMLVDAQALNFAIRKGRTSAFHLAPALKKANAAILAGDLRVYPAYIPSRWNLADPASRGRDASHTRTRRTHVTGSGRSGVRNHFHQMRKSVIHLRRSGIMPGYFSEDASWWSSNSSSAYGQPPC